MHVAGGKPLELMMVLKSSTPAEGVNPRAGAPPPTNVRLPFAVEFEDKPCVWNVDVKPPHVWVEVLVEWNARPGPVQVTLTVIAGSPPPGGAPPPGPGPASAAPSCGVISPGHAFTAGSRV